MGCFAPIGLIATLPLIHVRFFFLSTLKFRRRVVISSALAFVSFTFFLKNLLVTLAAAAQTSPQ